MNSHLMNSPGWTIRLKSQQWRASLQIASTSRRICWLRMRNQSLTPVRESCTCCQRVIWTSILLGVTLSIDFKNHEDSKGQTDSLWYFSGLLPSWFATVFDPMIVFIYFRHVKKAPCPIKDPLQCRPRGGGRFSVEMRVWKCAVDSGCIFQPFS